MSGSKAAILAIDFGTSSIKAGLVSVEGQLLWSAGRVFPQVPDYRDWHSNQWIFTLEEIFADFARARSADSKSVPFPRALAVSGNGPTLVLMGEGYKDRRLQNWPVLLWMTAPDSRIKGQHSFYLPKIKHFREHGAAAFSKVRRFISGPEYISWMLTGVEWTVSPGREFQPYIWDEDSLAAYGLDPGLFPPVLGMGEPMGSIDRQGAEFSSIPEGTPVISAGSDFLMSLIGTGVVEPGLTCDRAGTSEGINYCSRTRIVSPRLRTLPHALPGLYNVAGILSSTGRMFEWFRTFSHQRQTSYVDMMNQIAAVSHELNAPWFFPSLHTGDSFEFRGGIFAGLQPEHGSPELGRAVVNAIGFSIRNALEYLDESGCTVDMMRSCGGQAKNPLWNQMKADLTGVSIETPVIKDAELTGCAILGFIGLGEFSDMGEAVSALVHIDRRFDPDPAQASRYSGKYLAWKESYEYIREAAAHLPHIRED